MVNTSQPPATAHATASCWLQTFLEEAGSPLRILLLQLQTHTEQLGRTMWPKTPNAVITIAVLIIGAFDTIIGSVVAAPLTLRDSAARPAHPAETHT